MVQKGKLILGDTTLDYKSLTIQDSVKATGRWDAQIQVTEADKAFLYALNGYETAKVYRGAKQVFQGYLRNKPRQSQGMVPWMPLGGPEWTGKLNHYLTDSESITGTLLAAIGTILVNSPFIPGDIVATGGGESSPVLWNTTLEFLDFAYSTSGIIYENTEEVTKEIDTTNMVLSRPNLRSSFWYDGATKRFYVIAYDTAATLLKYCFTADGVTFSAWTTFTGASPAATEGAAGYYSVAWNGNKVYLIDKSAVPDVDMWRGTINDATGAITLAKVKDNITAANCHATDSLWAPIVFDDSNHVWAFIRVASDGDREGWESTDDGANWTRLIHDAGDKKYAFALTDGDIACIYNDAANTDVEEWVWDRSAATFAQTIKIDDWANNAMGFVSGYKVGASQNYWIVWEDVTAGLDADIRCAKVLRENETVVAIHKAEVVGDALYTAGCLQLAGGVDESLYLFYKLKGAGVNVKHLHDGVWQTAYEFDVDIKTTTTGAISVPERGLALFCYWLDAGDDTHFSLFSPHGLCVARVNEYPSYVFEDFEGASQLTGSWSSDVTKTTVALKDTAHPYSGVYDMKVALISGDNETAVGYKYVGNHLDEVYAKTRFRISAFPDTPGDAGYILTAGHNSSATAQVWLGLQNDAGVPKWYLGYYTTAGVWTDSALATPLPVTDTDYQIELYVLRNNGAGVVKVWIDGVLVFNLTGLVMYTAGREINYVTFGNTYMDCPLGGSIMYFDDCQASAYRIGVNASGNAISDDYAASGSFVSWGHLTATDEASATYCILWDVLKASDDSVQIADTTPTVDLSTVSVAITIIQVKLKWVLRGANYNSEVSSIGVSEVQGSVDVDVDYEKCGVAVNKVANILNGEFKLRWDGTLDFAYTLGEDKSDRIILLTAKSQSKFPLVKPNIRAVIHEPDFDNHANSIILLGAGDPPSRVEASAQDSASIITYGEVWDSVTNKDCTTAGMAQVAAQSEVTRRKDPMESISVEFIDDYDPGEIEIGDTVRVIADEIDLDVDARVIALTYTWSEGGENVTAELVNPVKVRSFSDHLKRTNDLLRWI